MTKTYTPTSDAKLEGFPKCLLSPNVNQCRQLLLPVKLIVWCMCVYNEMTNLQHQQKYKIEREKKLR